MSISILELTGFPNMAKKGDVVNGKVGAGNNLQWDAMWIKTVVKMNGNEIFNRYVQVPAKTQYNYDVSFTMPDKAVTLVAENWLLLPEENDFIRDAYTSFNVALSSGNGGNGVCTLDSDCPAGYVCKAGVCVKKEDAEEWLEKNWKYLAMGGGAIVLLVAVLKR